MNSRGQLWSLDVVLAAVVFTLALGVVISQSELHLFYDQQDTQSLTLWNASLFASNMAVSKPDVGVGGNNIRCGPAKWSTDNDLSWMENCLLIDTQSPTPTALGIPPGYSISFTGLPSSVPANTSYYSITRTVLVLPASTEASGFRQCMDGACPGGVVPIPITLTVWRDS